MSISRQNLSVVIVNFKSDHVIYNCINSIDKNIDILVVDNSNNVDFKKNIEKKYDNVKCILSPENIGMGAGNNLGIKNVNKDFVLILNPDVILQGDTIDEIINASHIIDSFGIMSPISNKIEYPNYKLDEKEQNNFDAVKPFKVKSVDGYAMLLNLKRLKKINNFNFFDENFFLYLENDDLCLRVKNRKENIYIIKNSLINHTGGISKKQNLEYLRNWHWMWSKFYFNKKHYGFLTAFSKIFFNLFSSIFKSIFYLITLNHHKKKIYQMRVSGLVNSIIGKKSFFRIND